MLEKVLRFTERLIPKKLYRMGQPFYHYFLALGGALLYRFPSRKIHVVGITGTKGKSTTTELVNSILEEAGYITAVLSTIRFKIAEKEERNLYKMTMPGRFFVQKFLNQSASAGCNWAIIEMTSEGARLFRHKFISLDALIFTNLSPEHIESHGSFKNYRDAKRALGKSLEKSPKKDRAIVANADDAEGGWYLGLNVPKTIPFSLTKAEPFEEIEGGYQWTFKNTLIRSHLPGTFNLYNQLAAASFASHINIKPKTIKSALEKKRVIRGRVEFIQKEPFSVVVDYAHTPDSLEKFYSVFENGRNICVLGNTGGGRDTWKRPKMASIAEENCHHVIFTNEDPYDENPRKIIDEMVVGITNKEKLSIILNRRDAIHTALGMATRGDNVLITGKGTDPYIMEAGGKKTPWDDATVVREELAKMGT